MDLVGPLLKSSWSHEEIVIVNYATYYPITKEQMLLFSQVGIPMDLLSDDGIPFISKLMQDSCSLLQVNQFKLSVYHLQTDGLAKDFNQTLKKML